MDIFEASRTGNLKKVKELIRNGININLQDNTGYTAIMYASANNDLPLVKELLSHGADVNLRNVFGNNALELTTGFKNSHVSLELLAHGAIPNTPLQEVIQKTNNAILTDTSIPENINLSDFGCDVIERGCSNENKIKIKDFITENINTSIIIKVIDSATHSRHFLYTRDNLNIALKNSVVYPCLEANNIPGIESNVVTDLPLYSLANIINVKLLVKKDTLDTILQNKGDLFIVINKHVYSYPSIASHEVVFNQGYLDSALHCNSGAEYEKLYTIKRVNVPVLVDSYYKKFQKYISKLNKI
jgi:hypothetical protein